MSPTMLLHQPLLLLLILPIFPPLSMASPYSECSSHEFRCGANLYNVSYPFWLPEKPDYCGHPHFQLICEQNTTLLTYIGSKEYLVNAIDYPNRTLFLTDPQFAHPNYCPLTFTNISLNFSLFDYALSDANLTVYLDCAPSLSKSFGSLHSIPCPANGNMSFYSLPGDPMLPQAYVDKNCKSMAIVPVNITAVKSELKGGRNDFATAVKKGFGLTWSVGKAWCDKCAQSGGICGYDPDPSKDGEACFCSNSTSTNGVCVPTAASRNGKRKLILPIAIGVSAGVAFILALLSGLFWFKRKKRLQKSGLSNLLSRNDSLRLSSKKDPELAEDDYHTHIFTYDELQEATEGFSASRELGDGGFGTVYKGKLRDGRTVAVKRLYENNYRRLEQFMNEIVILSRLRHQNLVTLYGCTSRHSRELLLVYEFIPNGTLADHIHGSLASKGALPWSTRMSIAIETADALAYLHAVEPQIIHRDVKTTNILLDNNFHVKVADFGLSRLFPLDATHVSTAPQGTPGYVDPEYHQCYQLTDKSDVYSFGVVLVELVSSKPAVDISRHRHEINLANMAITKIQNRQIDELVDTDLGYHSDAQIQRMINQVLELAFRCLQPDRDLRPCIKEVLEVLRGVESGRQKAVKDAEVAEAQAKEESRLLKNASPFSPDSVTEKWPSRSSTPNSSN